jgi:hypothetical protein
LRDTEPGSLLFGALQLVIGTSAVVAAIGLVKRARWAAGSVEVWGVAAGVSWFARRIHRGDVAARAMAGRAPDLPPTPVLLAEARRPAEPIDSRAPEAHVSRGTQRHDDRSQASGAPNNE